MKHLDQAAEELANDGIVAIPTETVYGLAGNAMSEAAVKKIFEIKGRPSNNPLIVHIKSLDDLGKVAKDIPDVAYTLAKKFWPGPLTLILKKKDHIAKAVTGELDTVAVRVPNHTLTLKLLEKLDFPLAVPSANPFSSISPTTAAHVFSYFGDKIKYILDGGECQRGLESTIVGFDTNNSPVIFRYGSISVEEIERLIGPTKKYIHDNKRPTAPGMLSRHYSPGTECYLTQNINKMIASFEGKKIGLLLFKEKVASTQFIEQEVLSETGNMKEAAKNLYGAMHKLDQKKLDVLLFQELPETGLGITINDKLRRASSKF
ncbi:L-threonylcarbamoyladenylate synthase [Salegentibacter sp. HM20]